MDKTIKTVFLSKGQKYSQEKERLIRDLDNLFPIIEDAQCSYEIWWILVSKEGRGKYFYNMLHYKEFFQPTAIAHITSVIINLYKLFETRRDTLSFTKLIKEAEKLGFFDSKQVNNEYKEAKGLWIKISALRNKVFAHQNYQLSKEAIYEEAKLKPDQIKRLIELSLIIFNTLRSCLGKTPKKVEEFSTRDTDRVFEDLLKNRVTNKDRNQT